MKMSTTDMIIWVLLVIGGLNWGLVGAFDYNIVSSIFGEGTFTNVIYILVGLAAVWGIVTMFSKSGSNQQM
ncbi:MAG: DUF378 domain-containing protein [Patescibacteria group bacterium]